MEKDSGKSLWQLDAEDTGMKWYDRALAKHFKKPVWQINQEIKDKKQKEVDAYKTVTASNGLTYERAYKIIKDIHMRYEANEIKNRMTDKWRSSCMQFSIKDVSTLLGLTDKEKEQIQKAQEAMSELLANHPEFSRLSGDMNNRIIYTV